MAGNGTVLGFVGSPNRDGLTNQLVRAALKGASEAGAATELIQISEHVVAACKDCIPWVCKDNRRCTYEDEAFEFLTEKVMRCGALVFGTPVYWWDSSAMVKYFILKIFRVFARSAPLQGLPALGVAVAGGTGNGLVSGLRQVYHFFQVMQMRALEPVPATRFNFREALIRSEELGGQIAGLSKERIPFAGMDERLAWYDDLPYLGLNRAGERRLLADLVAMAVSEEMDAAVLSGLARADAAAAAGRGLESRSEATRVYEACVKAFEKQ